MGRHPEGNRARELVLGIRMTPEERKQFDIQRWQRGNLTRGQYLRLLMESDRPELPEVDDDEED
jgi:hypothetical protein